MCSVVCWNFSIKRVTGVTEVKPNTVRYTYSDGIGRLSTHSDQFKPLRVLECDRDYTVEGNEIVFEERGATANLSNAKLIISSLDDMVY
jgi:hypothetical protein